MVIARKIRLEVLKLVISKSFLTWKDANFKLNLPEDWLDKVMKGVYIPTQKELNRLAKVYEVPIFIFESYVSESFIMRHLRKEDKSLFLKVSLKFGNVYYLPIDDIRVLHEEIENGEIGEEWNLKIVEMRNCEYLDLPEFEGH